MAVFLNFFSSSFTLLCSILYLICAAPSTPIKAIQAIINTQYNFRISYRKAWLAKWFPIQNEHQVASMHVVPWMLMPDPKMHRKKGRPKSTRTRNEMDWKQSQPPQSCGLCNQVGHNRRRCPHLASGSASRQTDDEYHANNL
ncbi:hypothetical protein RIF29_39830 [Crotalaria pallida]|uniref:Uncharacterized protein n=1 Tax=Crotalaria pallida TaxID=3830 RepID=A0AAN9E2I9_CROPI